MKKRILLSLLLMFIFVTLAGCTTRNEDLSEVSQTYPWALATDSPKDTVTSLFAHKFAEEVMRLSDGAMKIEVYENGTLGSDRELIESCMSGDVPFVIQNTAPQVSFMPELAVFDLPLAYTSLDELHTILDDEEFYQQINEVYLQKGFRLLGMGDQGFRVMTTNQKITSVEDFSSQKIRTMENPFHIGFWQSIGANPTPMTFSEVYIGLQQGTIDAQENPYEVIVSGKLYEQQEYVVETNHLPHLLSLIMNDDFYQALPQDQQAMIDEAAENAKVYAREQASERVQNRLEIITDSGTEMIVLDEELTQQLRDRAKGVYEDIRKQVGNELYDAYINRK